MTTALFPLQYQRQNAEPIDVDSVFATTADRNGYLTNPRRYPGQVVADLEDGFVYVLDSAGTAWTQVGGSGGTPGGLDTQVQFNDGGAFGAEPGFTYNKNSGILACDAITFRNVYQTIVSLSGATGTVVHNFSLSSLFNHTAMVSNFTVNVTNLNLASGYVANITLVLTQGAAAYMPNSLQIAGSVQTIYWVYGVPPVGTVNGRDIVNFSVTNIDDTYSVFGQSVSYS